MRFRDELCADDTLQEADDMVCIVIAYIYVFYLTAILIHVHCTTSSNITE